MFSVEPSGLAFIDDNDTLCLQQRFEEMESNINDLRDEIKTIKAEKNLLEKRIQTESEVRARVYTQ